MRPDAHTRARIMQRRLDAATDLSTVHRFRLAQLSRYVTRALTYVSADDVAWFLCEWEVAMEREISAAHAAAEQEIARPAESYVPGVAA